MKIRRVLPVLFCLAVMAGCGLPRHADETGVVTAAQLAEPLWIRNGEPVVFDGEDWFPTDEVENFLDGEIYQAGTYREVPLFIEKTDVRPFDRVYTRFAKNRYRAFEQ